MPLTADGVPLITSAVIPFSSYSCMFIPAVSKSLKKLGITNEGLYVVLTAERNLLNLPIPLTRKLFC